MSFFGFSSDLPRERAHPAHSTGAPGFGQAVNPFDFAAAPDDDDQSALDFNETYAGLDDENDAFNDDTFGEPQQSIGRDFDYSGATSKVANTIHEEAMLFEARSQHRPQAQVQAQAQAQAQSQSQAPRASKPARTGYESYNDPNYIPQLEVRSDIWGIQPKQSTQARQPQQQQQSQAPQAPPQSRKMMSLEEVEASMRAPKHQPSPFQAPQMYQQEQMGYPSQGGPPGYPQQQHHQQQHQQHHQQHQQQQQHEQQLRQQQLQLQQLQQQQQQQQYQVPHSQSPYPGMPAQYAPQVLQRPQENYPQPTPASRPQQVHAELPAHAVNPQLPQSPAILQRPRPTPDPVAQQQRNATPQPTIQRPPSQPRQILQNPNRLSGQGQAMVQAAATPRDSDSTHTRGQSFPGMVITHPDQLRNLTEEQRAAFLEEDAKRAKRNHKIALLSKDNGLMTPQDKNFITRIQLQQLMTATGILEEAGSEAALAEDFYYQVFSQIRGASRQTPNQPANLFAQTYLFQTNSRYGPGRRNGRGGDNHMQRMEQQVQRAVEAAKAKPKGRQLVLEGSLGKIAFSNSKTPRPLLNIKRSEIGDRPKLHKPSVADRKEVLRNIEAVYLTLMHMEDHERAMPAPISEDSDPELIQKHMEWRNKIEALHSKLWQDIKVMEPINPHSRTPHPFIAILSHGKGKKVIPRLFRHIDDQERITVVTMIVVHLDNLSVVSHAIASPDEPLSSAMREEVELFSHSVMPALFGYISEAPLNIVIGLIGLILDRTNVHVVARSKIGMALLTILISRAELLKQAAPEIEVTDWEHWTDLYNRLFDTVEPVLPILFPGTANDTDDIYVWQFLAAMGVGASPEQQQRLVVGVKDRVMETVTVSKVLPAEMAGARLANVNLFMRAIGLDVELLG